MKTSIQVKSKAEGSAIARGLGDPVTRATAAVVGVLLDVPPPQRARVLRNVNEALDDAEGAADALRFAATLSRAEGGDK